MTTRRMDSESETILITSPAHKGLDVMKAESVEIIVSRDRQKVWLNVNGVCLIRIDGMRTYQYTDHMYMDTRETD